MRPSGQSMPERLPGACRIELKTKRTPGRREKNSPGQALLFVMGKPVTGMSAGHLILDTLSRSRSSGSTSVRTRSGEARP